MTTMSRRDTINSNRALSKCQDILKQEFHHLKNYMFMLGRERLLDMDLDIRYGH